jgi:murein DD-endopeptidase MepM/ murein hydrolase activator NlpD
LALHLIPIAAFAAGYTVIRRLAGTDGGDGDSSPGDDIPASEIDAMNPTDDMTDHSEEYAGWHWPVPAWGDYAATRSQEYKPATHHGVDIMYPRSPLANASDKVFRPGTPNGSKNYFMPDGVPVMCPRAGTVWSTGVSQHGPWIVIDCGKPIALYMVHFDSLLLAGAARGTPVAAGQMIGTVGFSPADGERLKHLHIEIWRNGASTAHVDPWPYLKGAVRS